MGGTGDGEGEGIRSSVLNMLSFRCLFEIQMEKMTRFRGDVYGGHLNLGAVSDGCCLKS